MNIPSSVPFPFNYIAAFFSFCWTQLGSISFFSLISIRDLVLGIIIYELVCDLLKKIFGKADSK